MQYAIEKSTNNRIDVAEALYTRNGGDYCCEVCGQRVHKRILNQQPFFYHDGEAEVYCTKDTWELEESTSWHKRMQKRFKESIPTAQPEKYMKRSGEVHRADVFVPLSQNELVIELQSSGINISHVQQRNMFYAIDDNVCLWVLNTAKLCAQNEIRTIKCTAETRVIESDSTLMRNVIFGRTSQQTFVCIQQNDDMFAIVLDAEIAANENGMRQYTLSQSYTWNELIELICSGIQLEQVVTEAPSIDVLTREDEKRRRTTLKNSGRYASALASIKTLDELKVFVMDHLCELYQEIPLILNHRCLCKADNYTAWREIIHELVEYSSRLTAAILLAYLDDNTEADEIDILVQMYSPQTDFAHERDSLLWYYCAQKTEDTKVLTLLARHTNEQVRIAVCCNSHTPLPVIMELAQDHDCMVQRIAMQLLTKDECATLLIKMKSTEAHNIELTERVRQLEEQLRESTQQITQMQASIERATQTYSTTTAELMRCRADSATLKRNLAISEQQLNYYQNKAQQEGEWITQEHAWCEWEAHLLHRHLSGMFIFLLPHGRYGQELRWIRADDGDVIPIHTLEYYRADQVTRSSFKWKASYLPSQKTVCRLIGYHEACKLFGDKYVNARVWQN